MSDYDVAIVGAGPAGAATARRLAQAGCRVLLLERSRFDTPRVGESLAPNVQPLLVDLGVWTPFLDLQPLPSYGTRSVWGAPSAAEHSHLLTPYLSGWHVDRLAFDRMLTAGAQQAGAHLYLGARLVRCVPAAKGSVVLHVAGVAGPNRMAELRADFVIDASGRHTALARWVAARRVVFDRLVGIAVQFNDAQAGSHCYTLVETTPDGWWYAAPVAPDRSVVMLMTDGDLTHLRHLRTLPQWQLALQRAALTSARVDGATLRWGPQTFSAVSQRLLCKPGAAIRWLAVGDAALAVDPISGSGVVRALRTAQEAVSTVLTILAGDTAALGNYEAARNEECTAYLIQRAAYYGMERRWPNAPFWQRRAAATGGANISRAESQAR